MRVDRKRVSLPAAICWPKCRTAGKRLNPRVRAAAGAAPGPHGHQMPAALGVQSAELQRRYRRRAGATAAQCLSAPWDRHCSCACAGAREQRGRALDAAVTAVDGDEVAAAVR